MPVVAATWQVELQTCVVEEARTVFLRWLEQLRAVGAKRKRLVDIFEGSRVISENDVGKSTIDNRGGVVGPTGNFTLSLIDHGERARGLVVACLYLSVARQFAGGKRFHKFAALPFERIDALGEQRHWIPAFAGMTNVGGCA